MAGFAWADHACRHCGSRLACSATTEPTTIFECGNCSLRAHGAPDGICGCGISLGGNLLSAKAPRFRCAPNPERSVANPSAVVILFGEASP